MQNVFTTYKQIENTLKYLTTIAEETNEGIAVVDLDNNLQFVNDAWALMHGYKTKDKLIGNQLSIFHTTEQMKSDVIPLFEKTKDYGQIEGTVEHIKCDGTVFLTKTKMILIDDEAGNANEFIVFASSIRQHTMLRETTVENLKRIKQLSERIIRLQTLLGKCLEAGENLSKQTVELQANNEILLQQIGGSDQSQQRPIEHHPEQITQHKAQETTSNQQPEDKNPEFWKPKEASAQNTVSSEKSKSSTKLPNPKELGQAVNLASRLSGSPANNLQNEHENNQKEFESHINRAISEEWMHAVQKHEHPQ